MRLLTTWLYYLRNIFTFEIILFFSFVSLLMISIPFCQNTEREVFKSRALPAAVLVPRKHAATAHSTSILWNEQPLVVTLDMSRSTKGVRKSVKYLLFARGLLVLTPEGQQWPECCSKNRPTEVLLFAVQLNTSVALTSLPCLLTSLALTCPLTSLAF